MTVRRDLQNLAEKKQVKIIYGGVVLHPERAAQLSKSERKYSLIAGGLFHTNTLMFESPEGLETIKNFRASKAFISAGGIDEKFGVTCLNTYERATKKAVIVSSQRRILVADSSKFGQIRSDFFAALSEFQDIVTDSKISARYVSVIRKLGIRLHIA